MALNTRPLGKTGIMVSEIGFGAWAIGGDRFGNSYGPTDDKESIAALRRARELGCNFFDTADVYGHGHSENLIGEACAEFPRSELVFATKVGGDFYHGMPRMNFAESYIYFAVEESLKRLRTDYLDMYQLHNPPMQLITQGDVFKALEKLKEQGKIRFYGLSIHDPRDGLVAMQVCPSLSAIQVVYNYFRREASDELFQKASQNGVGIIAREPLFSGMLTGKYTVNSTFPPQDIRSGWRPEYLRQVVGAVDQIKQELQGQTITLPRYAINFVLRRPTVSVVIPGMKTVAQVEDNFGALLGAKV